MSFIRPPGRAHKQLKRKNRPGLFRLRKEADPQVRKITGTFNIGAAVATPPLAPARRWLFPQITVVNQTGNGGSRLHFRAKPTMRSDLATGPVGLTTSHN